MVRGKGSSIAINIMFMDRRRESNRVLDDRIDQALRFSFDRGLPGWNHAIGDERPRDHLARPELVELGIERAVVDRSAHATATKVPACFKVAGVSQE